MGLFGKSRGQSADGQAFQTLSDLYVRRATSRLRRTDWKFARDIIENILGQDPETIDTSTVAVLIKYLEVPEPQPLLEDFLPVSMPTSRSSWVLSEANRLYQADRQAHPQREKDRLEDLEVLKNEHQRMLAEDRAEFEKKYAADKVARLERHRAMWPAGVELDEDSLRIYAVEDLVRSENEKIEETVRDLTTILARGLEDGSVLDSLQYLSNDFDPVDDDEVVYSTVGTVEYCLRGREWLLPVSFDPKVKVAYARESRLIALEYELPDVTIVPKTKSFRYVKSKGRVTEIARPASQIDALYADAIAQLTLMCLARTFSYDNFGDAFDVVVFNGVIDTIDPRTGRPIRPCLITVRVTRETFAGLDIAHVDPLACLKHLSAGVSRSLTELVPVRPVLELSMVDPRFIAETDALSAMDTRPNLMDLTPGEFETLIQNLFTKMGLEARQTRPSRDGGVDCVAYDTRPIFGGKVVIQAKRYKNTVGVSAVRDLFGTLQNEGASKGILVTTSGYGSASFDFAQNKPIELLDGANLLYLLEAHAGITARIEPPDDWLDPSPDSPPPFPDDDVSPPPQ
jgi:HJR/Mrr/RecB family endonuclease